MLFDDNQENLRKVREVLHCSAMPIDPAVGLTAEALLRGLGHRLELNRLAAKKAATIAEYEDAWEHAEKRRKILQNVDADIGKAQADLDNELRIASRLEKLDVAAGWWLAVPLVATERRNGAMSHAALDWQLMKRAEQLFSTCAWPSLEQSGDSLVRPLYDEEDEELRAGPVPFCALATYETGRNWHSNLLQNVHIDTDGTVSGDRRSRQLKVSAHAERRSVQADGGFRTMLTERKSGYKPRLVRLLPLRSSQLTAVRLLKRLIHRLEHLVRVNEPDVAERLAPDVPLDLLSAALTHPGASAEAVSYALPPMARMAPPLDRSPLDRFRHDERGCCQWEELEWLGDAFLRFYSVSFVIVTHKELSFAKLSPAAERILSNEPLHRQALKLHEGGLATLTLCAPFVNTVSLSEMRKQACTVKDQADPMESLLGAIAIAAVEASPEAPPLAAAVERAFRFFSTAILPSPTPFNTAAKLIDELVNHRFAIANASPAIEALHGSNDLLECAEGLRALLAQYAAKEGLPVDLDRVRTMLNECCVWNRGAVFERAEFLGDAFLQVAVSFALARKYPSQVEGDAALRSSAPATPSHSYRPAHCVRDALARVALPLKLTHASFVSLCAPRRRASSHRCARPL